MRTAAHSDSGSAMADDKITQLRDVSIFATLHEDALWSIAECASDFDAAAGQVLVQPNQPGNGLLILTAGHATVELGTQTIDCGRRRVHRRAVAAGRRARAHRPGAGHHRRPRLRDRAAPTSTG